MVFAATTATATCNFQGKLAPSLAASSALRALFASCFGGDRWPAACSEQRATPAIQIESVPTLDRRLHTHTHTRTHLNASRGVSDSFAQRIVVIVVNYPAPASASSSWSQSAPASRGKCTVVATNI